MKQATANKRTVRQSADNNGSLDDTFCCIFRDISAGQQAGEPDYSVTVLRCVKKNSQAQERFILGHFDLFPCISNHRILQILEGSEEFG
jgi:hypothetical protein